MGRGSPDYWTATGGQSDEISQMERRSLIWNDDGILDGTAPPAHYTAVNNKGKFFPRGMRGKIEEIQIYCRGAVADGIMLSLGPYPGTGLVQGHAVTPLAGWSWVTVTMGEMWNYDGLFIWVWKCEAGVDYAYDDEQPWDLYQGDVTDRFWNTVDQRLFIRIIHAGQTPGDVPVSGTINSIAIPSSSAVLRVADQVIAVGVELEITGHYGMGYCDYLEAEVAASDDSHLTWIRVYCDDVLAMDQQYAELNDLGHTASTPTVSLCQYAEDGLCYMVIHKRFEFGHQLAVCAYNATQGQMMTIAVHPNVLR